MTMRTKCALLLPLALIAAACTVDKSSDPLSPTIAGPLPGVNITAPRAVEPLPGASVPVDQQPITLVIENASSNSVRPLSLLFEVAVDADFANKLLSREGIVPEPDGTTSFRLPDPLATERTYYWRVRGQDGANTGPFSDPAYFKVYTPVVIQKPALISPINDVLIATTVPSFVIGNAARSGPAGALIYQIEVGLGDALVNKSVWTVAEQPGQTTLTAPSALSPNTQYFWHARGIDESSATVGPWSDLQTFRTPAAGGGGGQPCGPPYPGTPLGIVACQRSHYGYMSSSQIVSFLVGVAKDLNAAGIAGGPFGILRKSSGANCDGYSCDIICAGQGTAQQQWDVLSDAEGAQAPNWAGPHTYPGIRLDTCEIQ
jgi:hypothetical protein